MSPAELAGVIDRLIEAKWVGASAQPAPALDDADFLRRASLDLIGRVRAGNGELIEKPWDASRRLYKALTGDITFGEEHVIARDMWAIRRYGRRQMRRLEENYRAGVERDVALLRSRRNGHQ